MPPMDASAPVTTPEICAALHAGQQQITQLFERVDAEQCFAPVAPEWCLAEHIVHLCLAYDQIIRVLGANKERLLARTGAPDHASLSFEQMHTRYTGLIAGGLVTTAAFTPQNVNVDVHKAHARDDILQRWDHAGRALRAAAEPWTGAELDGHQVPHPVMGMVTVRELLFFCIVHDANHLDVMRRLVTSGV